MNDDDRKELLKTPEDKYCQKEVLCQANWQLFTNGAIGKLKCRKCGVYVTDGGTPKCLLNEKQGFSGIPKGIKTV